MIYRDLQNLTSLANSLSVYIESDSKANHKENIFGAIIFLFYVEEFFDAWGRSLFRDEDNFDLTHDEYLKIKSEITNNMDKIRSKMEEFVNKYGREKFKQEYQQYKNNVWLSRI
jgi:hypothetical protein